jgi:hypothetical protein
MTSKKDILATNDTLVQDIRGLIEEARSTVATTVNTCPYHALLAGRQADQRGDPQGEGDRAGYGQRIVHALSAQLHQEYGQGFTKRNLFNMIRFAQVFPVRERDGLALMRFRQRHSINFGAS